jgi:hypothetical protein
MKYIVSIFCILFFASTMLGQLKPAAHPLVDSIYQQWTKTRKDSLRGMPWDTFYYAPQVPLEILDDLKENLLEIRSVTQLIRINPFLFKDTTNAERIILTQAEVDSIIQGIAFSKQFEWPEGLFVKGQRIRLGSMDTMRRVVNKKQGSVIQLFPYQLHLFSFPILFRNNTLCLFFSGTTDVLGGMGEFWLYRKEKEVWAAFGRVMAWMDLDLRRPEY